MLRTTTKKVTTQLQDHVLDNFTPDNYGAGTVTLQNLVEQLDAMRYGNHSVYHTALEYVEGGSLLVYYNDVRKFLKDLLEETEEEASQYTNDKSWHLYCHLVARTMSNLYDTRKKELARLS